VVAAPSGPLVVRSRRAGDRVRAGRRDMSLKRFLIDRRVPADLRPRLPLVAAGNLVVWVPGQAVPAAEAASEAGSGFVRLELQVTP
jgi:tRNA(Ile)-lysidine synthase